MNCNTTHYRANSSSVPGDPTQFWQAFAAGLVLGCIPTIRYPDSLVGVGFLIFLIAHARKLPMGWKHITIAAAGAAVPILPLLMRNQLLLGAFWRTGYALTNEQTGFSWEYFKEHALQYIQQVHSGGLGLPFGLAIVGVAYMICTRTWRQLGVLIALITIPLLLLYMAYYWAPNMSAATMRFLLPTFPPLVVAGIWVIAELTQHAPHAAKISVPIALLVVQMLWAVPQAIDEADRTYGTKHAMAAVTSAVDEVAQRGDVVVANGLLLQHLDYVKHWKLADESLMNGGGGPGGRFGRDRDPDAPSPMQSEKREALRSLYSGTQQQRSEKFDDDVRKWAGTGHVYLVGAENEVRRMLGSGAKAEEITIVKRVPLPQVEQSEPRGFGGGGFGGPPGMQGGRRNRGFGGPGGPMGGPGGGPMGGFALNVKEYVIAEWKPVR